jgi:hypothetical protein
MYYCSLTTLTADATQVLGTQYAAIELFNVGGTPPTTLSAALSICKAANNSFDAVNGAFAYSGDSNSLQSMLDTYFAFDPFIFEMIIGAVIVAFAIGLSTGHVVKMIGRT